MELNRDITSNGDGFRVTCTYTSYQNCGATPYGVDYMQLNINDNKIRSKLGSSYSTEFIKIARRSSLFYSIQIACHHSPILDPARDRLLFSNAKH